MTETAVESGIAARGGCLDKSRSAAPTRHGVGASPRKRMLPLVKQSLVEQSLVSGMNFLTSVLVGRFCGPTELGVYSLAFAVFVLIVGVQEALVGSPYTVYGNRVQDQERARYAASVLFQVGFLAILASACLAGAAWLFSAGFGPPGLGRVMWVLAAVIPLLLLREFCRRLAYAHLEAGSAFALGLWASSIQVGGLLWLIGRGELSAASAFAVIGLASGIAGVSWMTWNHARFALPCEGFLQTVRRHWLLGRWILANRVASVLNRYAIPWMLALLVGTTTAGVYAACAAVVCLCNPLILGVSNVLTPKAARAFAEGGCRQLQRVVWKAAVLLGGATGGFCLIAAVFGDSLLRLLCGEEFAGNGYVIGVLAVGTAASSIAVAASSGLLAIERSDADFAAGLIGVCVTLTTSLCLIRPFGILGAAYGLLFGAVTTAIVTYLAYRSLVSKEPAGATR